MADNRLIYLPLGGAGEVGMNAYVYGYGPEGAERLILVDLGVTFPNMDTTPGVDLIFPDLSWLLERVDQLEAIIITHGHEDHIGALGHFWERLGAPVYARKFTGALAARKLDEHGGDMGAVQVVGPWPDMSQLGPFKVSFLPVSHSIPESSAIVIDTPAGRIIHTGDFKLDGSPVVGEPFDADLWREVVGQGVKTLVCDSTNVMVGHPGRSEEVVGPAIQDLVRKAKGMVVATTFASNVARVKTLADAATAAGRSVCLLGRAMKRMITVAQETGVLTDFPSTVSPEEAQQIPRENLMLLSTGSQGERRAATAQLARGKYLGLEMKEGDLFLFSSKTIPGNERGVLQIVNSFSEMGVDVVDDSAGIYHVSGHANGPDLEALHDLVKPEMLVPMHGEHRMLRRHAKLAADKGIATEIATNGTMLDLTGKTPDVVEYIESSRTYLDGAVKIGALDGVVRDRIRLALNGHIMVTLIIDEDDEPLGEPWAEVMGLPETGLSNTALVEIIEAEVDQMLGRAADKILTDDKALDDSIRRIVRQTCMSEIGKKPEVTVVVSRLA
ncbi:ribonuclease J [Actibacterium sp. 188UL27-1]|uniref:ribonuclease J n=1 Tax=Actibacterium sp. 188UL27-1 TaxID=2786961 RepID=UPI00195F10A3|nr:ribonuclease J [Actibacterium sp. 188UL27-1]MBM7067737.1 ribonuclease J [Actibacterium sp. 188UL27-1]